METSYFALLYVAAANVSRLAIDELDVVACPSLMSPLVNAVTPVIPPATVSVPLMLTASSICIAEESAENILLSPVYFLQRL